VIDVRVKSNDMPISEITQSQLYFLIDQLEGEDMEDCN